GDVHIVSVQGSYTQENQALNYSTNAGHAALADHTYGTLDDLHLTASYLYQRAWGAAVGYFQLTGSPDATLYQGQGLAGATPNSNGFIYELSYRPWLNTRLSMDYATFGQFDGGSTNYGGGRAAWDNNTTTMMAWLAY
ncbi:MAG TPA: hypothetical protein VNZ67_14580, partial [bacterium]|nr:hypothetical protein [bacterium]